jgi:hypothetical protein
VGVLSDEELNTIKASDLLKLMGVVEKATGLYNACEQTFGARWNCSEFRELGDTLRGLGLKEVSSE